MPFVPPPYIPPVSHCLLAESKNRESHTLTSQQLSTILLHQLDTLDPSSFDQQFLLSLQTLIDDRLTALRGDESLVTVDGDGSTSYLHLHNLYNLYVHVLALKIELHAKYGESIQDLLPHISDRVYQTIYFEIDTFIELCLVDDGSVLMLGQHELENTNNSNAINFFKTFTHNWVTSKGLKDMKVSTVELIADSQSLTSIPEKTP